MPSGERYNYSFLVCQDPIAINIVHDFVGGKVLSDEVFTESTNIQLGQSATQLTLNHLGEDTVQFQVLL